MYVTITGTVVGEYGKAFIFTVIVKLPPGQDPDNGVIKYVAVCVALNILVNVPEIVAELLALVPPVIPPVTDGLLHVYIVPNGTIFVFGGINEKGNPLQTAAAVLLAMVAFGFTVTVIVKGSPSAVPDLGVMVYVIANIPAV